MWATLGLKLVQIITGVGVSDIVSKATEVYTAHLRAGTDEDKINADLVAREIAMATRESELQATLAKSEPGYVRQCFAYPVAFYLGKIFVYDKALGLGATDSLSPQLYWIVQTVIVAYFGAATILQAVRLVKAK